MNLAYNLNAACIDQQVNRAEIGREGGGGAREGERESAYCASMRWLMATNHQVGTVEVMGEKAGRA